MLKTSAAVVRLVVAVALIAPAPLLAAPPTKTPTTAVPPAKTAPTPAPVVKKPKPKRVTKPKPAEKRLPDGVFQASLRANKATIGLEVTVVAGFVTSAVATLPGGRSVRLASSGPPDAANINLIGRKDVDFVRVSASFADAEIATGTYTGNLDRRPVSGSVELVKR